MRKRFGQVHSRESSATLQLTVSLLYQFGILRLLNIGKICIINMVTIIRNYWVYFSNQVDEMEDNLSLSVGNIIEFRYKIIHNY